jgi:HK97 family phage major capsid protein
MQDSIVQIQSAITEALSNSASKAELKQLQDQFMERLGNKSAEFHDVDAMFSKYQTSMESKFAEMQEQLKKSSFTGGQIKKDSFGDFLVKARTNDTGLRDMTRKALSEGTGADGGYLVPEEFMAEIQRVQLEESVVRANGARVINMNSNIMRIPALNMASNASGAMFGGIATQWSGEAESITASAPKFKSIQLEAKKLVGYVESSDELTNDSIVSMGGLLQDLFAQTIGFEEDSAFLTGNGVAKPLGILNAPATVAVTRTTASKVGTVDLIAMLARFYRKGGQPVWIINQTVLPEIYKLKDENSNYILAPGFNASISGALPTTIYGIPVIVSEKLPALGTSGDIMLADMRYYLIGDRQRVTVDESIHVKFSTDEKSWRFVTRVDGQPWIDSAITPRAGGSTLSPFVKLT